MRRQTPIPAPTPGCATSRSNYSSQANYERFLKGQLQGYVDTLNGFTGDQFQALINSRASADTMTYQNALGALILAENTLSSTIQCIQNDILQRNEYSSKMYTLQQDIENLRKELKEKQETVNEAKERSETLRDPYTKTTWWELWFPLGRPMKKEHVPVLLSISIFMLIFSLGIFLRFAGFELRLEALQSTLNSSVKATNARKYL
jgi:hypothetical protein